MHAPRTPALFVSALRGDSRGATQPSPNAPWPARHPQRRPSSTTPPQHHAAPPSPVQLPEPSPSSSLTPTHPGPTGLFTPPALCRQPVVPPAWFGQARGSCRRTRDAALAAALLRSLTTNVRAFAFCPLWVRDNGRCHLVYRAIFAGAYTALSPAFPV